MSSSPSTTIAAVEYVLNAEDHAKATLNILEDFAEDKERMEETQHAISNILEDFSREKERLEETQSATLNLLEDFDEERFKAEHVSRELRESVEISRVAKEAAEESNRQLETFSYSVAHDLRAPLRHISGFSAILLEECGPTLNATAQHYLRRIQDGTSHMGRLVDELLNLARIGRHSLQLQSTGLNKVVAEVMAILKPEMQDREVQWQVDDLPFVQCDPTLIKQVFQNLMANALKFTRARQHATIEISHKKEAEQTVIMVRDNGVGFNMKYADKLFGVFQRLHRAEDFEGTGIGLATVHRIIQKHGGKIWAEAELEKGAAFYFTVRAAEQPKMKTNAAKGGVGS